MVDGGLCLETMMLFWEERFHEQKWVLALFKWFQICCCPDRSHTYVRRRRGCTYVRGPLLPQPCIFSVTSCATDCFFDYATLEKRQLQPLLPVRGKVPSLKNVNGLLCYCRSTQELNFFYAKSLCYFAVTNRFGTWDRLLLSLFKSLQMVCIMYRYFF